ncbi:DUF397 domain-containing protein [Nocardia terpenica]|uniref:DUF397 domain-containing protein n=1 Tax=Nocardia terpenica TaxID=455432 RepID=A0A291RXE3_9NOCA|nr:DUF397 domain-containing protein [Nocardia terpenica]
MDLPEARWFKSTYSKDSTHCVEIAFVGGSIALRNSNHPDEGALVFTAPEWDAFIAGAKDGEFNRPGA